MVLNEAEGCRCGGTGQRDYIETAGPDGKRGYTYVGARYELTKEARRAYMRRVTPPLAFAGALLMWIGLMNVSGSRVLYVALPWALACFAEGLALNDAARVLLTKRALNERDYKNSALRLKKWLIALAALMSLLCAAEILYFFTTGRRADEYLPPAISILALMLSVLALLTERAICWKRIPPA